MLGQTLAVAKSWVRAPWLVLQQELLHSQSASEHTVQQKSANAVADKLMT